jgi:hypothetical protein
MHVTVVEQRTTALTTLARLKSALGYTDEDETRDDRLTELIDDMSSAIVNSVGKQFARQSVVELLSVYGDQTLALSITPVIHISEMAYDDSVISPSGWYIYDRDAGLVYRNEMWNNSQPIEQWINRIPVPGPGALKQRANYIGGYLLPGDDITCSGTLSADATDNSFNHSEADFPILASGEYVVLGGFVESENNGRHLVLSRTASKIVVASELVTETASGIHTLTCRTLPRHIERAVIYAVRDSYLSEVRDGTIASERLGDWSATYKEAAFNDFGVSTAAMALLAREIRYV